MESIASLKPSGKQHTNGLDKFLNVNSKNMGQKMSASTMLQKSFTSDNKMLSAVGLDSRPGTPKDPSIIMSKVELTPNSLKHKLQSGVSTSGSSSIKKSSNKKARHR